MRVARRDMEDQCASSTESTPSAACYQELDVDPQGKIYNPGCDILLEDLPDTVVNVEKGGPTVAKTMVLDKYPIVLRVVDGVFYIYIYF